MSPIAMTMEVLLALMLAACLYFFWRLDQQAAGAAHRPGRHARRRGGIGARHGAGRSRGAAMRATAQEAGRDLQARINDARATADRLGLGAGRVRSSADVGARGRI